MSMRKLHALMTIHNSKHEKAEEKKKQEQLNQALNTMRGL